MEVDREDPQTTEYCIGEGEDPYNLIAKPDNKQTPAPTEESYEQVQGFGMPEYNNVPASGASSHQPPYVGDGKKPADQGFPMYNYNNFPSDPFTSKPNVESTESTNIISDQTGTSLPITPDSSSTIVGDQTKARIQGFQMFHFINNDPASESSSQEPNHSGDNHSRHNRQAQGYKPTKYATSVSQTAEAAGIKSFRNDDDHTQTTYSPTGN